MLKIMKERWDKNSEKLRAVLSEREDMNTVDYKEVVRLTFDVIFNGGPKEDEDQYTMFNSDMLDLKHITEIDDGDYQGTLLFLIPFDTYQPGENEYLMTYVGYGSCSGCDTLQGIQDYSDKKLDDKQIKCFMALCKDIICNTIRPYNCGWRNIEGYEQVEED